MHKVLKYLTCKCCNKQIYQTVFRKHLLQLHNENYNNYIKNNIRDFSHTAYKICIECDNVFNDRSNLDRCGKCYTKTHKFQTNQIVKCNICNKELHSKQISYHLKKEHNIDFKLYITNNLEDFKRFGWCNCNICGKVTKKRGIIRPTTCSKECKSKIDSLYKTGKPGIPHTEETKKKLSDIRKKDYADPRNHPFYGRKHTEETKQKISKIRIESGVASGSKNPMYGKTHTPEAIEKIFSFRKMNKLEKIVAEVLDKENIKYKFQFFITLNGICKSYDFKIQDKNILIEVDGDYWHGNSNLFRHFFNVKEVILNDEIKNELAMERGYKVIRLWESDIKKDPNIIIKSINNLT